MGLKFNILCFEDNPGALRHTFNVVEKRVEELGFIFHKHPVQENGDELKTILKQIEKKEMDVDLILMDYQLSKKETGKDLIDKIRNCELFTDIVFYSQKADFDKDIDQMGRLEGVFFSDRKNLPQRTVKIIENLLKKSLDLTNFRGLVMAETSELDEIMFQILHHLLDSNAFQETITKKNRIKNKYLESKDKEIKEVKGINLEDAAGTQELLLKVGAFHRARAVTRLIKDLKSQSKNNNSKLKAIADNIGDFKLDADEYNRKIISLRNLLAHVKEEKSSNGQKILKSTLRGEGFVFDEAEALVTRQTLKKYFSILANTYKAVSGKEWN
jgi:CheY-like chemotaxis protein